MGKTLVKITIRNTPVKEILYTEKLVNEMDQSNFDSLSAFVYERTGKDLFDDNGKVNSEIRYILFSDDDDVIGFESNDGKRYFTPGNSLYPTEEIEEDYKQSLPKEIFNILTENPNTPVSELQKIYLKIYKEKKKIVKTVKSYDQDRKNISEYKIAAIKRKKVKALKQSDDVAKIVKDAINKSISDVYSKAKQYARGGTSKNKKGIKRGFCVNKGSYEKRINSLSKIPSEKVTAVTNQVITSFRDVFDKGVVPNNVQFKKSNSADLIIPNKNYNHKEYKKLRVPSTAYYRSLAYAERDKLKFLMWYGCYVAATYFQMLVSNTPIDEPYSYEKTVVRHDKPKRLSKDGLSALSVEESMASANIRKTKKTVVHTPDNSDVRGDWILTFRGKRFKAFETEPFKYGPSLGNPSYDKVFKREMFENKVDQESIKKIAKILYLETKDSDDFSCTFEKENINPLWMILEKGGYKHKSAKKAGAKYTHGVDGTHLTYQAPYGFVAVTDATFETLTQGGAWKGYVYNFVNPKHNHLNVSDINHGLMKKVLERHPELKKKGNFTGVY